ncbi:hypothetical protein [Seohaeicola sp. 4SK31]|uniref:hypothetical protein n=1 Tax=Seohaeicola sp. 4SK31 TaxID=3028386 RepID=UPI00237A8F0A|nr:hypothetical protein [Seohaeicola sp. 4SK31]
MRTRHEMLHNARMAGLVMLQRGIGHIEERQVRAAHSGYDDGPPNIAIKRFARCLSLKIEQMRTAVRKSATVAAG